MQRRRQWRQCSLRRRRHRWRQNRLFAHDRPHHLQIRVLQDVSFFRLASSGRVPWQKCYPNSHRLSEDGRHLSNAHAGQHRRRCVSFYSTLYDGIAPEIRRLQLRPQFQFLERLRSVENFKYRQLLGSRSVRVSSAVAIVEEFVFNQWRHQFGRHFFPKRDSSYIAERWFEQ